MARFLAYVVVLGLVTAAAVWLADHPGRIVAEWLGFKVETSMAVALVALLALIGALLAAARLASGLVHLPLAASRRRREQRRRQGYQALTDGLAAAIGGEAPRARKLAGRADKLLGDPTLTTFLSAQAAKLAGDRKEAAKCYALMLERKETAALGLKGLLEQALEDGDDEAALDLVRRAMAANPDDPWLFDTAIKLAIKGGQLDRALDHLAQAKRKGALSAAQANRRRAQILLHRASQAEARGEAAKAQDDARAALKADGGFAPAVLLLARLLAADGKARQARATLEAAWKAHASEDIAHALATVEAGEQPLARLGRLDKLMGKDGRWQAHLALGEAALEAKVWGQARRHLTAALEAQPSAAACRLLARLEREEYGNETAAAAWIERGRALPAETAWTCGVCGGVETGWALCCPACGAVDSLSREPRKAPGNALQRAAS